jgi:hypothetical protein
MLEHPDQPPPKIRAHLAGCAPCREWQRNLLRLEHNVAFLPVPSGSGKSKLLYELLGSSPDLKTEADAQRRDDARRHRQAEADLRERLAAECSRLEAEQRRHQDAPTLPALLETPRSVTPLPRRLATVFRQPRRRVAVAVGVAASLVIILTGWWAWHGTDDAVGTGPTRRLHPADPFLAGLLESDVRLAEAETSRQRIEALADLADNLQAEMCKVVLGAETDDVVELARLYGQVVREGVVVAAKNLPSSQRRLVLDRIADRLARTEREVKDLAQTVPASSSRPLTLVAAAAHDGDDQLRALLRE